MKTVKPLIFIVGGVYLVIAAAAIFVGLYSHNYSTSAWAAMSGSWCLQDMIRATK